MSKQLTSSRITRWVLLLHEFNVTIIDRQGKSNVVNNFLSRLDNPTQNIIVDDTFPDEYFFFRVN